MTLPLDPQEPSGPLTQEQFGPYTVFERLGVGGMATVHRAKQRGIEGIERVVALKRLLPHLAEDATFIKSFVREAKLALMLHHANVVQLFELGKVGGVYFIAMEYIDGRDVRRILRQARKVSGPPTINVTLSLLIQACEALEYAHTKCDDDGEPLGLVHRDVSPSNLMVTRSGHLKVIDFGIAKAQSQQLRTQTGRVKGKLAYMAPEAIAGKELDARSDLFSIGVIAHELLTARPLFASKNEYQTLLNVQKSELIPPSAFNQAVPPELDAIVLRALARDPDERYGSAAELRDDLHAVRIRYQLSATNREVQAWSDWAFSLEAPGGNFSGPAVTDSLAGASRSPIAARTPLPLPLRARPAASDAPPARASSRAQSHDEEEAADVAWGGGLEQDSNREPVDDVPDYSRPGLAAAASVDDSRDPTLIGVMAPAAQSRRPTTFPHGSSSDAVPSRGSVTAIPVATDVADPTAPNPRASSPAFGAAIVEKRGGGAGKVALVGLALAALGGGGYFAFGRGGGGAAKPTATESVAPATGSLKFIVEPADAQVKIAGLEAHSGSPWQIDLEPGVIQVKVSRDGYVSWETSVELSAKETQTIRVVLAQAPAGPEANMAILVLDSEPQGLAVILDGQELPERTPIKLPVNPGAHTVSLRQNGEVVWRQKFDAEPRTQYEFAPSMSEVKRREREAREAALPVRDRVATTPSRPTPPVTPPPGPGPGTAVATVTLPPPVPPPSVTPPPVTPVTPPAITAPPVAPPPGPGTGSAKPVMPPPPPPVAKGPVVVPPTAVKRVSGELPRLTTIARPGTEVPPTVSVKICIDAGGAVTSATAYKLTGDVANGLTSAIKKWRYSPYVADGRAVGACFVNVFSLK